MNIRFLAGAALAAVLAVPAFAAQTLAPGKSALGFTFKQMGVPVEGTFKTYTAQVSFDPAKPEAAQATFSVDLGSIDVGGPDGNAEARKKAWFDVATFPKATFTAKSVKALGGGKYEARGPLVIKGVSRDIVAQFTAKPVGSDLQLDGGFPLKRLQYKLGDGAWADTETVADDVQVKFRFTLTGKP
ncbi:polyisoprenoid-binding protein [Chitiniphilus shinanonensis]|uniref:Polyisoprenoid-binding protein n=1 Tax=Chitiniphilus shinanonensis TaxID=553088 RepID=A0ABQ6BU70_9NEIS|nr:YceI family protein [Chitiniphilus shinanonensis]GLS05189.1 polyisoprenoid-binding protein [Chitiniphilus shinanonensis]